jgi:hypothetical protein
MLLFLVVLTMYIICRKPLIGQFTHIHNNNSIVAVNEQ